MYFVRLHAGEQNDRQGAAMFGDVVKDVKSINFRHLQVKKQEIDLAMLEELEGGLAVAGFVYCIATGAQVVA